MPIFVENRRTSLKTLKARYGDPVVLDVTSRGPEPWVRFSPFYPHGSIPIPFSPGQFGASVEGIWQGLKVFESADVDRDVMAVTTMKGIKRSKRQFGQVLGHRAGLDGDRLLPYLEARRQIYLPCYRFVLEIILPELVGELERLSNAGPVVLLDFQTNGDVEDLSKPLSHAALIKRQIEGDWPWTERISIPNWSEDEPGWRPLKNSQRHIEIERRVSPKLKADIAALVENDDTVGAVQKLEQDTGLSLDDCILWMRAYLPISRDRQAPIPCPYCDKMLRTMIAKQCLECGMDWHDPKNVVRHGSQSR